MIGTITQLKNERAVAKDGVSGNDYRGAKTLPVSPMQDGQSLGNDLGTTMSEKLFLRQPLGDSRLTSSTCSISIGLTRTY